MPGDRSARLLTDAERGTLAGVERRTANGEDATRRVRGVAAVRRDDKQLAESTLRDYRNVVNGYLLPALGADTPLEKITTQRLDALREQLLADSRLSRRSVQKVMVLLHGVLKRAKRRGWIPANPAEDTERVRLRRSGDFNVLSPVEIEAVARAAESEQDRAVFTVAAFTGLRLGELRALRWGDVDFTGRAILVRRNLPSHGVERAPKSGKVRSVPRIDQAARELDRLSRRGDFTAGDDRVFVSPTGDVIDDGPLRERF